MAEISKISKGGVEYTIKDIQGRAGVQTLEERVFGGKEVEWQRPEYYIRDEEFNTGIVITSTFQAIPYSFANKIEVTAGKKNTAIVDLSALSPTNPVSVTTDWLFEDPMYEGGVCDYEIRYQVDATMAQDGKVSIKVYSQNRDPLGDEFEPWETVDFYYKEYTEPSLEERVNALDARVAVLESASGGGGGGGSSDDGGISYPYETELNQTGVDYLQYAYILNARDGEYLRVEFDSDPDESWSCNFNIEVYDGYTSDTTTTFNGTSIQACVTFLEGYWVLYFTYEWGENYNPPSSVYVQSI